MGAALNMNKFLDKQLVDHISYEMGVDPSFIEKDFYATKILSQLSNFSYLGYTPVFSGGTCLSKAYGIIQRFSEDLDFNIFQSADLNKNKRQQIRHAFRATIEAIEGLTIAEKATANEGKKETLWISYPKIYQQPGHLREFLQVELFFDPEPNDYIEVRNLKSLIDSALGQHSNGVSITCNMPFNIMADKFTALAWRIYDDNEQRDYTLMRHLHDLHALSKQVPINSKLIDKIKANFETKDQYRFKETLKLEQLIVLTRKQLENESIYKESYTKFVNSMCYAVDDEQISFDEALTTFLRLAELINVDFH